MPTVSWAKVGGLSLGRAVLFQKSGIGGRQSVGAMDRTCEGVGQRRGRKRKKVIQRPWAWG